MSDLSVEYKTFISQIKQRIRQAQYQALRQVNKEQIRLYWDIGKMIVEKQEQYGWGKSVVEELAKELQREFPGQKGWSVQNLWYMRQFYLEYKDCENLQQLVGEIGWSHNIVIMSKCKDNLEREFYIRMTKKYGWSRNVLINQIESKAYEAFLLKQTNFDQTLPEKYKRQASLAVKDEYKFDFLDLGEEHSERELEMALLRNIRDFLREMGGDFSFIGNQHKLEVGGKEFYIDLLLYHRRLKSLVAIELKIGEFIPEYAGKMQFYLNVLNDKMRLEDENPAIGIIICKSKDRTIVEYSLNSSTQPIGVATYSIHRELPEEWQGLLPDAEQIIKAIKVIE